MSRILAIDPGNSESGYALIDSDDCHVIHAAKVDNETLMRDFTRLAYLADVVIEMVASYGMAVGKDVFETCVWVGRFSERSRGQSGRLPELVYRRDVKLHHCGSAKAKDANITQALIDRFASGEPNRGKGTKADPGWFYGFKADIWQAYALAVLVADRQAEHCAEAAHEALAEQQRRLGVSA